MSYRTIIGGITCLMLCHICSAWSSESTAILQRQKQLNDVRQNKYNAEANATLKRLHDHADAVANNQMVSFDDRAYANGFLFWEKGDLRAASREWFKFLEYKKIHREEKTDLRYAEVQGIYQQSLRILNANPAIRVRRSESVTAAEKQEKPVRQFKARRKNREGTLSVEQKKPNSKHRSVYLVRKAKLAKASGQLGYAQKLYKMAREFDPESEQVKTELAELEKEMQ